MEDQFIGICKKCKKKYYSNKTEMHFQCICGNNEYVQFKKVENLHIDTCKGKNK